MSATKSSLFLSRSTAKLGLALLAVCCSLAVADVALAQSQDPMPALTAKALIGDSVSEPSSDRYSDVAEAIKRFKNNDPLGSRSFLESALQKDPKLPPVGVLVAKMHLLAGNTQAVRPMLEKAVQEDSSDDPEPFLLLAEEALASNRIIESDALFDKAVELIESYDVNKKRKRRFMIRAYRGRAAVSDRRKNWEQAESDLRKWLQEDPENATALTQLGQVLFRRGEAKAGFEAFRDAKKANEKSASPYVAAAVMYLRTDKTAEAMKAFERALQEDPNDSAALLAYSKALLRNRNTSKAEQVLKKARSSAGEIMDVWLLSGVNARLAGDAAAAESHLLRALAMGPSNRDVLNQLAQSLIESENKDDHRRALSFAELNVQLNKNNPDANMTLAWIYFQLGENGRGNLALRNAAQGGSMSPDGQFLLAKYFLSRDDKKNARKLLEAALKTDVGLFVQQKAAEELLQTL